MERSLQRDLVEAAQHGDHEAFEVLAKGAADRLYALSRLILRDVDLAQDAVQETLIRTWKGLPGLRDPERFDAWLHRLLANTCTDLIRSRTRLTANVHVIETDLPRSAQRAVVVLRYYLGLSLPEVADTLAIPVGTAKSRLHYAMETLRAALEADARPAPQLTGKTA